MPTHGSLSKAGKVRQATPKLEKTVFHKTIPRRRNRRNYEKRILHRQKRKSEKFKSTW